MKLEELTIKNVSFDDNDDIYFGQIYDYNTIVNECLHRRMKFMKNDLVKNLNRVTFSDDEAVIYTDEVGNRQVFIKEKYETMRTVIDIKYSGEDFIRYTSKQLKEIIISVATYYTNCNESKKNKLMEYLLETFVQVETEEDVKYGLSKI